MSVVANLLALLVMPIVLAGTITRVATLNREHPCCQVTVGLDEVGHQLLRRGDDIRRGREIARGNADLFKSLAYGLEIACLRQA